MNFLSKLFGDCGKVSFVFELINGRKGTGKITIESFNNDNEDIEKYIENALFVKKGLRCKSLKIIGFTEI